MDRIAEYERIIRSVADWAARQEDIVGVAVVGSWARNDPRMDSDVDLVILTDGKERYRSIHHGCRPLWTSTLRSFERRIGDH